MELDRPEADSVCDRVDLFDRLIHEDPDTGHMRRQGGQNVGRDGRLHEARALGPEDEPDAGGAKPGREHRILEPCNPADLHRCHHDPPASTPLTLVPTPLDAGRAPSISRPNVFPGSGVVMSVSPIRNA